MKSYINVHKKLEQAFSSCKISVRFKNNEPAKFWFLKQKALPEVSQLTPTKSLLDPSYGHLSAKQPPVAAGREEAKN